MTPTSVPHPTKQTVGSPAPAAAAPEASGDDDDRGGELLPCPFCGGSPTVEENVHTDEAVRVACRARACVVQPASDYLLRGFWTELRDAWNRRPAPGMPTAPS